MSRNTFNFKRKGESTMLDEIKAVLDVVLKDDEFFELYAKISKKGFDALVMKGFTEDQAIQIVANNQPGVK